MTHESALQTRIVEYLSLIARRHRFLFFSVPNEATLKTAGLSRIPKHVTFALLGVLKKMGLLPGVSDLVIVAENGRFFGMEVKTSNGRLSDHQQLFRARCDELNIPYAVVRSVEAAEMQLKEWGITTGGITC